MSDYVQKEEQFVNFSKIKENDVNQKGEQRKIPKLILATEKYDAKYDNENLLTLFDDIILARSLKNNADPYEKLSYAHGEDILTTTIKNGSELNNFDSIIF